MQTTNHQVPYIPPIQNITKLNADSKIDQLKTTMPTYTSHQQQQPA